MVVIIHQTVGVAQPMKALVDLGKDGKKRLAVGGIFEDGFPLVTSGGDVVQSAVVFDS